MPYCFSGSSIKFQGHTGWKIDDLNPIWVRLLGRSQLSNPSDLPCYWSHGLKNQQFESNSSKITRPVAAIKSLRFALFHKYWSNTCEICTGVKQYTFHWVISSELVQKQCVFNSLIIHHLIMTNCISYGNIFAILVPKCIDIAPL